MPAHASMLGQLFAPYLDLSDCVEGALNTYGPPLSYQRLITGQDTESRYLMVQRLMPTGFRSALADLLGTPYHGSITPLNVPLEARTERWQVLCDHLERFHDLNPRTQHAVCHLLIALGYYELTYILLRSYAECPRDADTHTAALAYTRSFARFMLYVQSPHYQPDDVKLVAERSPMGSMARFSATLRMLVYHARFDRDKDAVAYWREQSLVASKALPLHQESFAYHILWSRFWRASSYLPLMRGEIAGAVAEMDLAEEHANRAQWATAEEEILWRANLYPVMQSQARLAEIRQDMDVVLARGRIMLQLDPWYSNAYMELANPLLKTGKLEEAAAHYHRASLLGPPVHTIAAFLAGYCYEQMGLTAQAGHLYVKALEWDCDAVSPREGLGRLKEHPGVALLQRLLPQLPHRQPKALMGA